MEVVTQMFKYYKLRDRGWSDFQSYRATLSTSPLPSPGWDAGPSHVIFSILSALPIRVPIHFYSPS